MLCEKCGRELTGEDMRFCPFCGAEIADKGSADDANWLIGRIKAIYKEYLDWNLDFFAGRGAGSVVMSLFTGNSAYKNSPQHDEFFNKTREQADKLCELMKTQTGLEDRAEEILRFALIDCHSGTLKEADLMFLAAEQLFIPILDVLEPEAAAGLYEPYKMLRKRDSGFKPQAEILKKLKNTAKKA